MSLYKNGFSLQIASAYRAVLKKGVLNVNELANALSIQPQGIYRILHHLEEIGLIEEVGGRPKKYKSRAISEAIDHFLLHQRNWFLEYLISETQDEKKDITSEEDLMKVSVILGRDELLERYNKDLRDAKKQVNLVVIGLPIGIPPETLYEEVSALKRGVIIRELVQEVNPENKEMLLRWIKNGIVVRQIKQPIDIHLILIDEYISYLGVFDIDDKTRRILIRFKNKPINQQLQILFEKHWRRAKRIGKNDCLLPDNLQ